MAKYQDTDPRQKLHQDEPWFFIRAQDRHAPAAVTSYAHSLAIAGDHQGAAECRQIAEQMAAWQKSHPAQVKDPD